MNKNLAIGLFLCFSSVSSFAAPNFVAQGKGYFCYQDYQSALNNAVSEADTKAQNICRKRTPERVSKFAVQKQPQGCLVTVQARYTCR